MDTDGASPSPGPAGLPHDAGLVGRTVRLPSPSGRRQRVAVDTVEDLGGGRTLVAGWLLYRAGNTVYEGCYRGRFATVLAPGQAVGPDA